MSARRWFDCSALLLAVAVLACPVNGARSAEQEPPKPDALARHDGQVLFLGVEVPADKVPKDAQARRQAGIIEQSIVFLAVEVQPGTVTPELCFTLAGHGNRIFCRWHEDLGLPRENDSMEIYAETRYFRVLRVGDSVRECSLVGLVDPTLAAAEMSDRVTRFISAKAEFLAAEKALDESEVRLFRYREVERRHPGTVCWWELRSAELTADQCARQQTARRAAMADAIREMIAAHRVVRAHEIRAPRSGVVGTVHKDRGDVVRNGEAVLRIRNP
jgi:hypothetical protein